jgi:Xaa-Pro aminopeptidase
MTDYKALCAELVAAIDASVPYATPLLDRARAALADREPDAIKAAMQHPGVAEVIAMSTLAQPKPKEPTKAELRQIFDDQSGFINDEQVMWWSDFQPAARAVLARWGNL